MQSWNHQYDLSIYDRALQWDEGRRDTTAVRGRIELLHAHGQTVNCVWTHKTLKQERYAVDHCFPWARWFNNDLWNLMPATERANMAKGDKLPSAPLLLQSKDSILDWWHKAWGEDDHYSRQFFMEAEAALPLIEQGSQNMEFVFHAMQHQRAKLKASQQLAEWILKLTRSLQKMACRMTALSGLLCPRGYFRPTMLIEAAGDSMSIYKPHAP
jgi:hypothetical protein